MLKLMPTIFFAFLVANFALGSSPEDASETCAEAPSSSEVAYYATAGIPFFLGVLSTVEISQRIKHRSYLHEIFTKFMVPVNLALASPVLIPLGSRFQRWWFSILHPLSHDHGAQTRRHLDHNWHDTQASYSPNAQLSRNIYATITGRISTNANRARSAHLAGDHKYAAEQIADAAIGMRLLFAEIKPRDAIVSTTMHMQFSGHLKTDEQFKERVRLSIAKYDPDFRENSLAAEYYEQVLSAWLD